MNFPNPTSYPKSDKNLRVEYIKYFKKHRAPRRKEIEKLLNIWGRFNFLSLESIQQILVVFTLSRWYSWTKSGKSISRYTGSTSNRDSFHLWISSSLRTLR